MEVYIDDRVHQVLKEFYQAAMLKHPALDVVAVQRKVERLYNKVDSLGRFASSLPLARVKTDWMKVDCVINGILLCFLGEYCC